LLSVNRYPQVWKEAGRLSPQRSALNINMETATFRPSNDEHSRHTVNLARVERIARIRPLVEPATGATVLIGGVASCGWCVRIARSRPRSRLGAASGPQRGQKMTAPEYGRCITDVGTGQPRERGTRWVEPSPSRISRILLRPHRRRLRLHSYRHHRRPDH
jgi:hypothetical protein